LMSEVVFTAELYLYPQSLPKGWLSMQVVTK
jgi:hypothetical protein